MHLCDILGSYYHNILLHGIVMYITQRLIQEKSPAITNKIIVMFLVETLET